jgi:hypothetical protein
MSLVEFLFHSENYLFTGAIILMLFIAILEGIMSVIGAGLSELLDPLIPDFDSDISISENTFALSKFFSWIRLKKVPILMLFVIFLTSYGLSGLFIQGLLLNMTSIFYYAWLISIPSFIIGIYSMRLIGGVISKVLPKDETSSLSTEDLIGHIAIIILGNASKGSPAEAKIQDKHGQSHYLMVEPEEETMHFSQGDKVLVTAKIKTYFLATNNIPNKLK